MKEELMQSALRAIKDLLKMERPKAVRAAWAIADTTLKMVEAIDDVEAGR